MSRASRPNLIYWTTTGLFSLAMVFSAFQYFTNPQMKASFRHLGFPDYFRLELGVAKIAGVIILMIPRPSLLKEWAYAGFAITLVSALVAHVSSADPAGQFGPPILMGVIFAGSYVTYCSRRDRSLT